MTIAPHALAGAALATSVNSPVLAFLIGFISHYVLDMIPHVEPGTFTTLEPGQKWPLWIYGFAAIEGIITVLLIYSFFYNRSDFAQIAIGGFGAITPDVLDHSPIRPWQNWPVFKQLNSFHEIVHQDINHRYWFIGAIFVLVITGGSLWYLLKY